MSGQDFSGPDRINPVTFNRALWRGLKGDEPYPDKVKYDFPQKKPASLFGSSKSPFRFVCFHRQHIQKELKVEAVGKCFRQTAKLKPDCLAGGDVVFDAIEVGKLARSNCLTCTWLERRAALDLGIPEGQFPGWQAGILWLCCTDNQRVTGRSDSTSDNNLDFHPWDALMNKEVNWRRPRLSASLRFHCNVRVCRLASIVYESLSFLMLPVYSIFTESILFRMAGSY